MSELRFRNVTISSLVDSYINGQKRSTFVSASVDLGEITTEEFRVAHLKAGLEVYAAAIQNAVCRQELKEEEARTRLSEAKENYQGMIKKLQERGKEPKKDEDIPF